MPSLNGSKMWETRQVAQRIMEQADEEARRALTIARNYSAPYSFWSNAKTRGLCTEEEFEQARRSYGSLWHYVGD